MLKQLSKYLAGSWFAEIKHAWLGLKLYEWPAPKHEPKVYHGVDVHSAALVLDPFSRETQLNSLC